MALQRNMAAAYEALHRNKAVFCALLMQLT